MTVTLLALRRLQPTDGRGLGAWAAACACFMLAAVLPLGSGGASLLLPALMSMSAYVLLYVGIAHCLERPLARQVVAVSCLLGGAWLGLAGWNGESSALVTFGVACVEVWVALAIAHLISQAAEKARHSLGARLLLLGLAGDSLFSLLQAIFMAAPMLGGRGSVLISVYPLLHGSFIVLWVIAMVMMVNEKIRCEWEFLATHDALTGVMTRGAFIQVALTELVRARRNGRWPTFLLIDLDHFKRVNDTYGHGAGDELLQTFARQVHLQVRPHDYFARYGGEEFVVMMPETTEAEGVGVAERIRQVVASTPSANGGSGCAYTISIGVSVAQGGDETLDSIIARADRALYRAKQGGRNRVEWGSAEAADLPLSSRHP